MISKWKELCNQKQEFIKITALLTDYDERTGRYRKYGEKSDHFMRKAVSIACPDSIRVFFRDLGGYMYTVAVELSTGAGVVITNWVHEDGIRLERDELADSPDHPVHSIICITDLYEKYSKAVSDCEGLPELNPWTREYLEKEEESESD